MYEFQFFSSLYISKVCNLLKWFVAINEPVYIYDANANENYYLLKNDQNTVLALYQASDTTGSVPREQYEYSSYGITNILDQNGLVKTFDHDLNVNTPEVKKVKSDFSNPFGYHGMWRDEHTGLYHTHYRLYDPQHVRWLTPDPAGYRDGQNLYRFYAGPNGVDVLGLDEFTSNGVRIRTGSDVTFESISLGTKVYHYKYINGNYYRASRIVEEIHNGKTLKVHYFNNRPEDIIESSFMESQLAGREYKLRLSADSPLVSALTFINDYISQVDFNLIYELKFAGYSDEEIAAITAALMAAGYLGGKAAGKGIEKVLENPRVKALIEKVSKKSSELFAKKLTPKAFGLKSIAENPELRKMWMDSIKSLAQNSDGAVAKYLDAIQRGETQGLNDLARKAFKSVNSSFNNKLEKSGKDFSEYSFETIHHWNWPLQDNFLHALNPANLFPTSKEVHRNLHRTMSSGHPYNDPILDLHKLQLELKSFLE